MDTSEKEEWSSSFRLNLSYITLNQGLEQHKLLVLPVGVQEDIALIILLKRGSNMFKPKKATPTSGVNLLDHQQLLINGNCLVSQSTHKTSTVIRNILRLGGGTKASRRVLMLYRRPQTMDQGVSNPARGGGGKRGYDIESFKDSRNSTVVPLFLAQANLRDSGQNAPDM